MVRKRRRLATWNWASAGTIVIADTTNSPQTIASVNIFPPARTDWLLENGRGRKSLTVKKILLWLQAYVVNPSTNLVEIPSSMDFSLQRINQDSAGTISPGLQAPYAAPVLPSAMTSWTVGGADEEDGLNPYLWTHRWWPSYQAGTQSGSVTLATGAAATNSGAYVQENSSGISTPMRVTQGWQPDVVVRSSRRLVRGQGIGFFVTMNSGASTNMTYNVQYACRVLTS